MTTPTRPARQPRKDGADALNLNRVLPSSDVAERACLAAMLLSPTEAVPIVLERLTEGHFYFAAHATVFRHLREMFDTLKAVDLTTLTQRLDDAHELDYVGGAAFLADLVGSLPTLANLEDHIAIVEEKLLLRRCIAVGADTVNGAFADQADVPAYLEDISKKLFDLTAARADGGMIRAAAAIPDAVEQINAELRGDGVTGLTTGLAGLDRVIGGLKPATMYVIAARPSHGKTAIAMQIAEHVSCELDLPVGVFSLEMGRQELMQRMVLSRARVSLAELRRLEHQQEGLNRITAAAGDLRQAPLFIDESASLTIHQIRARARRLVQTEGAAVIMLDYLNLVTPSPSKTNRQVNRQVEVAEISAGLKALAKELRIPVISLVQLNRSPENRVDGVPKLGDLRESGAIEQDADVVGLLYRERLENQDGQETARLGPRATLTIAKQRNGPTADISLHFVGHHTRFYMEQTNP
jgi:replicative DNA helicase